MISALTLARDLYSTSVLDLDTVACFLALHEIRFGPRKTTKLPVDLLSSVQPAQSASENPLTNRDEDFLNVIPNSMDP